MATSTAAPPLRVARAARPPAVAARAAVITPRAPWAEAGGPPALDVVIPVYNEQGDLERSVRRLHRFLQAEFPLSARITIVDNASTDATWAIAGALRDELDGVEALHLDLKGRGRALRAAWSTSDAAVLAYMDVDLATDLGALLPLVAPLLSGHSDVAIGSRLLPGSRVERGIRRELISRSYNLLLRTGLRTRFSDAQCGFKALRAEVAARLLPRVEDQGFFFDTELLVLAERAGLRIHEVAVDWTDDPDSRVDIVATALADLRGMARVRRALHRPTLLEGLAPVARPRPAPAIRRPLLRFAAVGVVSTAAYVALYAALRPALPAAAANAVALLTTAVANTAANRRLTFGVRTPRGRWRHQAAGLAALGLALGITTTAISTLQLVAPAAPRALEIAVLVVANLGATLVRFAVLRAAISGTRPSAAPAAAVAEMPVRAA